MPWDTEETSWNSEEKRKMSVYMFLIESKLRRQSWNSSGEHYAKRLRMPIVEAMMAIIKSRLLKQALKEIMIPALLQKGYVFVKNNQKDEIYRFGRLFKPLDDGDVIMAAIIFHRYAPSFCMEFAVSPAEGIVTDYSGEKIEQMDVWPSWVVPSYSLYSKPRSLKYFSTRKWFVHSSRLEDYERLVHEVVSYLPEVDIAMRKTNSIKSVVRAIDVRVFQRFPSKHVKIIDSRC
jgi:hypothetical protein